MENFDDYLQKKLRDPEMRHMFDTESASLDRVVKAPKIEGDEYDVEYMSPNPDHTTHCVCRRVLEAFGGQSVGCCCTGHRCPDKEVDDCTIPD